MEKDLVSTWSHMAGASDVQFDPDGRFAVSCGEDKNIRVHPLSDSESQDRETSIVAGSGNKYDDEFLSLSISPKRDRVALATSGSAVLLLTYPDLGDRKVLARFAMGVHCVQFDRNGERVAAGGKDMSVKLIRSDTGEIVAMLHGHKGTIRTLKWDPLGEFVATSSCDGSTKIWNVVTHQCEKTFQLNTRIDEEDESMSQMKYEIDWVPLTGSMIAVPVKKSVHFYYRLTWKQASVIQTKHTEIISIVKFSSNGGYFATAGMENQIIIHAYVAGTRDWTPMNSISATATITSLDWNPRADSIFFLADDGSTSHWRNPVLQSWPKSFHEAPAISDEEDVEEDTVHDNAGTANAGRNDGPDAFVANASLRRTPERDRKRKLYLLDDEAEEGETNEAKKARYELGETEMEEEDGEEKLVVDEDELVSPYLELKDATIAAHVEVSPHTALQPSSTPLSDVSRGNCFLCWNMIGKVVRYKDESTNRIEIIFNDVQKHRNIKFGDDYNLSVGSLGNAGAIFGAVGSAEEKAIVYFHPFESITNEWTFHMEGENPLCVAIGDHFCAVATSTGYLRVLDLHGQQLLVVSIAGVPVTSCAFGDLLGVVYSDHSAFQEERADSGFSHRLRFSVFKVGPAASITTVHEDRPLPITPGSSLSWIGFSNDAILHTVDTKDVVRSLLPKNFTKGTTWMPVFDGDKHLGRKASLWVIGIVSRSLLYVPVREGDLPSPLRIPVPSRAELTIPLLMPSSLYENELLFAKIAFSAEEGEVAKAKLLGNVEANLLHLFQQACTSNRIEKARAILNYFKQDKSLVVAVKIAEKCKQRKLSLEILNDVKRRLELRKVEEAVKTSSASKQSEEYSEQESPGIDAQDGTQPQPTQSIELESQTQVMDAAAMLEMEEAEEVEEETGDDGTKPLAVESDGGNEFDGEFEPFEPEGATNDVEAQADGSNRSIFDIIGDIKGEKA